MGHRNITTYYGPIYSDREYLYSGSCVKAIPRVRYWDERSEVNSKFRVSKLESNILNERLLVADSRSSAGDITSGRISYVLITMV
jgi:hypothetical protein